MKKLSLLKRVMDEGQDEKTAQALILSGRVRVNGIKETRSGVLVKVNASVEIFYSSKHPSRAAEKLSGALKYFQIDVSGRNCLDIGASHGGFSSVLLEAGAKRVYALDVAYGIFDYTLRNDARVVLLERKIAREISVEWFEPALFSESSGIFITCDLSFISLKSILGPIAQFAKNFKGPVDGIFLIKPQFEASHLTEKGIVRDDTVREKIVNDTLDFARSCGISIIGAVPASIPGAEGNIEYTSYLRMK